jgi:hypothetical protein
MTINSFNITIMNSVGMDVLLMSSKYLMIESLELLDRYANIALTSKGGILIYKRLAIFCS